MITVEQLNEICRNTLVSNLGMVFTRIGDDFLEAEMPVDARTMQPTGILHGGASLALAETLGGAASFNLVDLEKYNVVGMQISGNHVGTVSSGVVYARAELVHLGVKTHVWDVTIRDIKKRKISVSRITNMIVEKTNFEG